MAESEICLSIIGSRPVAGHLVEGESIFGLDCTFWSLDRGWTFEGRRSVHNNSTAGDHGDGLVKWRYTRGAAFVKW
jgi:hypothetical protein